YLIVEYCLSVDRHADERDLHSFPTRRSSDLGRRGGRGSGRLAPRGVDRRGELGGAGRTLGPDVPLAPPDPPVPHPVTAGLHPAPTGDHHRDRPAAAGPDRAAGGGLTCDGHRQAWRQGGHGCRSPPTARSSAPTPRRSPRPPPAGTPARAPSRPAGWARPGPD